MTVQFAPAAMSTDGTFSLMDQIRRILRTTPIDRCLKSIVALLLALLLLGMLSGCKPAAQGPPPLAPPMNVGITGYNFTNEGVQEYYVNGSRGSNLPAYGGGGKTSCCVSLPEQWTPEVKVKVEWITGHWTQPIEEILPMDINEAIRCCLARRTIQKIVPVERYGKEGGGVQVFFLPNDEIKVWVTDYDLGHNEHPSGMVYPRNPYPNQ